MQIQPYLFFNGRAEEALEFYREVLAKAFGAVQDKFGLSWMVIAGPKQ